MARKGFRLVGKLHGKHGKHIAEVSTRTKGDWVAGPSGGTCSDGPLEGEPPRATSRGWWK